MRPADVDRVLMSHTPAEMVPLHGEFVALERVGHRFLIANDGLWIEARREWIHAIWPLARQRHVSMPFGTLSATVDVAFARIPEDCMRQFADDARKAYPLEVGAVVLWQASTGRLRYHLCQTIAAGEDHLQEKWPTEEGWEVVGDLHSHGKHHAFFSAKDRRDMGSQVLIAGVLGCLDRPDPDIALALFICGLEVPCNVPVSLIDACRGCPVPTDNTKE